MARFKDCIIEGIIYNKNKLSYLKYKKLLEHDNY